MQVPTELCMEMKAYFSSKWPLEGCGLITGTVELHNTVIRSGIAASFYPIDNISNEPETSFVMDPRQFTKLLMKLEADIIGFAHSHPTADSVPSLRDRSTFWKSVPSHWIVSYKKPDNPLLNIFTYKKVSSTNIEEIPYQLI
jgi:proteasome lid subunit RPN8/RPN11